MTWVEFVRAHKDQVKPCDCGADVGQSDHQSSSWAHTDECSQHVSADGLFEEWRTKDSTGVKWFGEGAWKPEDQKEK